MHFREIVETMSEDQLLLYTSGRIVH